jgi:acyl carrier protein
VGRIDNQVKIRGYRIELAEIEASLLQFHTVKEAVVIAREDESGKKRLIGYVVAATGKTALDTKELGRLLAKKLPDYMVPSEFILLDTLPLTPNGKVDRRALPRLSGEASAGAADVSAHRTPIEELLAGIWTKVLDVERVGLQDNFFDIGGHSLNATQLIVRLRDTFNIDMPLRTLFEAPTVESLAEVIKEALKLQEGVSIPAITRATREAQLPLSYAQQRLWFLHKLEPASAAFNLPMAVRVRGELELTVLERALTELVARHEILRTTFTEIDGIPVQVIGTPMPVGLVVTDLSDLPEEVRDAEAYSRAAAEAERGFDLARGPLLRVSLLKMGEGDHVVLFTLHHIISDGWSMGLVVSEIAAIYEALREQKESPLKDLPVQYADYAYWQRGWLQGDVLESQLKHWKDRLSGAPEIMKLPTDRPRPEVLSYRGSSRSWSLSAELSGQIREMCRREGVTLFMALLASFQAVLNYYTDEEDLVVGTDVANRNDTQLEQLIGFFVNQLVLRTDLSGNPTFKELLGRVRQVTLMAYAHQDVPFEKIVEAVNPQRNLRSTPLFQVKLVLQNQPASELEISGLSFSPMGPGVQSAKCDIVLHAAENDEIIQGWFEYSTDLFDLSTIDIMIENLQTVLQAVVATPDTTLGTLRTLLGESDKQRRASKEEQVEHIRDRKLKKVRRKPSQLSLEN